MPATKLKAAIAQVLKDEGFILDYQVGKYQAGAEGGETFVTDGVSLADAKTVLRVYLKYVPEGERVIRRIDPDGAGHG